MHRALYHRLLLFVAIVAFSPAYSQFVFGWSGGYMPAFELNREIYIYNAINRQGLDKEMPAANIFQGPMGGYRKTVSDGYFELLYSRKTATVASKFDSAGVPMARQLKVISNTFNWGFAYGSGAWKAGMSIDFGFCKMKGRRGINSGLKDISWTWLATPEQFLRLINRMLPDASTVWVEREFGQHVSLRLYAQLFWLRTKMNSERGTSLDYWFFGTGLNWYLPNLDRFNSYGLALTINFGK